MRTVVGNQIVRHHAGAANGGDLDSRCTRRQAFTIRNGVAGEGDIRTDQLHAVVTTAGDHVVRNQVSRTQRIGKSNPVGIVIDQLVVRNKIAVRSTRDRYRSDPTGDGFAIVGKIVLRNCIAVPTAGGAVDDDAGTGNTGRPIDEVLDTESGDDAIAGLQHKPAGFSSCPCSVEYDNGRSSCIARLRSGVENDGVGNRWQG